jgi:hypothetical protein
MVPYALAETCCSKTLQHKKEFLGLTTTIFKSAKCVTSLTILPVQLHVNLYSVVKYGFLSSPESS